MKKQKVVVCDSGTLINLSMNGLLYIIEELKKLTGVKFVITNDVKYEVIDRPIGIPRFELGALRIKHLIDNRSIELPENFSVEEKNIKEKTAEFMELANHSIESKGVLVKIVSNAEMSCLALGELLLNGGFDVLIAIDERTTRLLGEKPESLENIMASKLHSKVELKKQNFEKFRKFRFIRSTELVFVAYKKGLIKINDPKALEAVLYATKFKGASVSFDEINVLKKM